MKKSIALGLLLPLPLAGCAQSAHQQLVSTRAVAESTTTTSLPATVAPTPTTPTTIEVVLEPTTTTTIVRVVQSTTTTTPQTSGHVEQTSPTLWYRDAQGYCFTSDQQSMNGEAGDPTCPSTSQPVTAWYRDPQGLCYTSSYKAATAPDATCPTSQSVSSTVGNAIHLGG